MSITCVFVHGCSCIRDKDLSVLRASCVEECGPHGEGTVRKGMLALKIDLSGKENGTALDPPCLLGPKKVDLELAM